MKKVLFFALFLVVLGTANVSAQVRIGGDGEPHTAAVLDLNTDNATNDGTKGLALPRVSLSSATDLLSNTTIATGTLVYNTGGALSTGVYYWDDSSKSWNKVDGAMSGSLRITSQPAPFSFSRLRETVGDPNGPVTATVAPLSVTATGTGTLTYQWYELPRNRNIAPGVAPGVSNAATYTPDVTAWGMRSYYCEVSNGTETVVSKVADVAIGCGAKTANGGWIKFSCYNLGADTTLDPFTYVSKGDSTSRDIKGWLFQWGRAADGHQWRNDAAGRTAAGPISLTTDAGVPAGNAAYGKFITNTSTMPYDWRSPQNDIGWRHWPDADNVCPSGWNIPTADEWSSIFDAQQTHNAPDAAIANTWTYISYGFLLKPDGITTSLFLPCAGLRNINGNVVNESYGGHYWSSTPTGSHASQLILSPDRVGATRPCRRGYGNSVRCKKD